MSNRLEEIARRKQTLVAKAARERAELAAAYNRIRSPFDIGGTLGGLGRLLKSHPLIAAGISSFLVSGFAGKLLKSAGGMLKLWSVAPFLWAWWKKRRNAN